MQKTITLLIILITAISSLAQITFTEAPKKLQLYARDLATDSATIPITGTVNKTNYSAILVKLFRDKVLLDTLRQELVFDGNVAPFSFAYSIRAECAMYKFEVRGINGTKQTVLRTADSVVAGDVIIIQGQSNAEAAMRGKGVNATAKSNNSPYIRVFGWANEDPKKIDTTWHVGQGDGARTTKGNTGQWGLRLARLIVDNHKIPVAVFNGAHGGRPIEFFQRNDAAPADLATNYGRLLFRFHETGLGNAVRAVFWHQGESNAKADLPMADYMNLWTALRKSWLTDYKHIEKTYLFQIRRGCKGTADQIGIIKEAHRRLADGNDSVVIMSTSGVNHFTDNCHYTYKNGYELFANTIYRLVDRDLYGAPPADDIEPPDIAFAEVSGEREITLLMKRALDSLRWVMGSEKYFRLEGSGATVNGGSAAKNRVVLALSGSALDVSTISFLGHDNTPEPMVYNRNEIGAVHFYKFPLTKPAHRDSVCIARILEKNGVAVNVGAVATFDGGGRVAALRLANRNLSVIPSDIAFLDGAAVIDLSDNNLAILPRDIVALTPSSIKVDGNRLCSVSDELAEWLDAHADNPAWRTAQGCGGTGVAFGKSARVGGLFVRQVGRRAFVGFEGEVGTLSLYRLDGSRVLTRDHERSPATLDLSSLSLGFYFVQVRSGSRAMRAPLLVR